MALLSRLAIIALAMAGCYTPDLRDCKVTCTTADGCADGEVCGADGFCAGPGVTCNHEGADAGSNQEHLDAGIPMVNIHIMVAGKGKVMLNSTMSCDSAGDQHGDCTYGVPASQVANLLAVVTQTGHVFMGWNMGCSGILPQCTLTPAANVTVAAMFH